MAGQENQQYTVLYGRLSQEDERAGESNSIQHQRTLLEKYAKEKGFENTIFLADAPDIIGLKQNPTKRASL